MTTKTTATTTVAIAYTTATTGGRAVGFDVPGRGFDVPGRGGTAQTTRRHIPAREVGSPGPTPPLVA